MSAAARSAAANPLRSAGLSLRVAFLGSAVWLDGCFPTAPVHGLLARRFQLAGVDDAEPTIGALSTFRPHVTVIFAPLSVASETLAALPGVTLGVLVGSEQEPGRTRVTDGLQTLDRLVSFTPALTGTRIGGGEVWRAIAPPVSDVLFSQVRPLHRAPRPISIGSSTPYREAVLMPAKHHHDLLQVIHGVSGEELRELLHECDVGVFVPRDPGGGFGLQVGMHLASGHLLLVDDLTPAHGLERDIDYLAVDRDGLVWVLDRLGRFPEMYQRIRIRGRLKAEQYRASRLFQRLAHDLLNDVAAFGAGHTEAEIGPGSSAAHRAEERSRLS
jgi:hypothetical protein